jgi:hypothetical protein
VIASTKAKSINETDRNLLRMIASGNTDPGVEFMQFIYNLLFIFFEPDVFLEASHQGTEAASPCGGFLNLLASLSLPAEAGT